MFSKFPEVKDAVSVHLVEVSSKLRDMQYNKLCLEEKQLRNALQESDSEQQAANISNHSITKHGPEVSWYNCLQEVPKEFSFYIAHEFFDALPIHKFQVLLNEMFRITFE